MTHNKAAVIVNKFWAGVFSVVCSSAIVGGIAYAVNANEKFIRIDEKVESISAADLPERMARMEERMAAQMAISGRIEKKQDNMDDKLDKLLRKND